MRGLPILVLLVVLLPTTQPGPSSSFINGAIGPVQGIDAPDLADPGLLITEVCPGRPVEYVVITNLGAERRLNGTIVSDGEGNITFLTDRVLVSGSSVAVASDEALFRSLHPEVECVAKGSPEVTWSGRFALADSGDSASLWSPDGVLLDAVAYGTAPYTGGGWSGPPVSPIPKAHALVRMVGDHDVSTDWSVEPPGRSHLPSMDFEAIAELFSAPEDAAGRIVRELELASRTVNCSVYELTDPGIVTALARCGSSGVDVNILVEGQPVGGLSNASLSAIATLQDSGADVRVLRSSDSYKRYDYLHSKYFVVDGHRAVVMSENWGKGLYANRGWGACLEGTSVASYYDGVFERDFEGTLDVTVPNASVPTMEPVEVPTCSLDGLIRFRCTATPILAPDNAAAALSSMIAAAQRSVLVEQLSVDSDWLTGPSLVTDLIAAAQRGVQVRLLLDSSWGGGENKVVAERLNAVAAANGLDLEARIISNYHNLSVMHNKGIIADEQVAVSSINWGDGSLYQNREAGVILSSPEASSFFSRLFWLDWSIDPSPPTAVLPWSYLNLAEGEVAYLDGTMSRDNAGPLEWEWDVDGDGTVDNRSSAWAVRLPTGNHSVVLTVRDRGNNTASATCWIEVRTTVEEDEDLFLLVALPLAIPLAAILWKRIIGWKRH